MALFTGPRQTEQHKPFTITEEPPARFIVGLSWNPDEKKVAPPKAFKFLPSILSHLWRVEQGAKTKEKDKALGRDMDSEEHDLDLYCYVFDNENQLKAIVGPEDNILFDPSGGVFHSGDATTGSGVGDDEIVSVVTTKIPAEYSHFFFVVKSDSKFSLDEINDPRIRLADGKTDINALSNPIASPPELKAAGYIFCHVARTEEGWTCRNLDTYTNFDENWNTLLSSFNVVPGAPPPPEDMAPKDTAPEMAEQAGMPAEETPPPPQDA